MYYTFPSLSIPLTAHAEALKRQCYCQMANGNATTVYSYSKHVRFPLFCQHLMN